MREKHRIQLVPRYKNQGYDRPSVERRRQWLEGLTSTRLAEIGGSALDPSEFRGNIENVIGTVQMPLGVAGPLDVRGEHAEGTFYVPLATTEGALIRSYERGMVAISRSGGAQARVWLDRNRITPVWKLPDVAGARDFARAIHQHREAIVSVANATTNHGRLETVDCLPVGSRVLLDLGFATADAHGMNMLTKAADAVCRYVEREISSEPHYVMSGYSAEKRAAGSLFRGGKGKKVTAGCRLSADVVRQVLHATPEQMLDLHRATLLGQLASGAMGYNGHVANGLTALFIATGQDVANIANSALAVTTFDIAADGALEASVTLPSLSLATVGGGTGLGTSRRCLELIGCFGTGCARKLAEIAAATVLAGELSMGAALASGEFAAAHEAFGRNRPVKTPAKKVVEEP